MNEMVRVTRFKKLRGILVAGLIAGVGLIIISGSRAATPTAAIEAEIGTISGNVTLVDHPNASDGGAVRFSSGAAYYVDTAGSDSNNGSSGSPWKTIQKAVSSVPANATIAVRSGTYAPFSITQSGVTIKPDSGATVIVAGQAGTRDVVLLGANNVTLKDIDIRGCVPGAPSGSYEDTGHSGVRINDGTSGVVLDNVKIHDSHGTNSQGLPVGCYAVMVHGATNATIKNSEMYHNGYGIFVNGGGNGLSILNNSIHDNDVIIRNTTNNPDDDYGAVAIGFVNTTSTPGPLAQGNTIYNNVGASNDYGSDGGGFEIYKASNLTMNNNTLYNNENVLETGTDSGAECQNNRFTNNTASGKSIGSTIDHSAGLILRCNRNMVIDGNTFTGLDWWTFVIGSVDMFGGAINGLTITDNMITQGWDKIYALLQDPGGLGFNFSNNRLHSDSGIVGSDWNDNTITSLSAWRTTTGLDSTSIWQ